MMTNENIKENFNLCINWLKENVNKIGNAPLYIGWGEDDYSRPWLKNEFHNKDCNVALGNKSEYTGLEVSINMLNFGRYIQTYGYEREGIDKWVKSFEGTGMRCMDNRHTFDEVSILYMEKFLLSWKSIKKAVLDRIAEVNSLDNFEL